MNKKIEWQTPELVEVAGKNTGLLAACGYGNFATPDCNEGRVPSDGSCAPSGTQALTTCSTGSSVQ